jgi:dienelactone hydrolase
MLVEMVRTTTEDGLRLDGMLQSPTSAANSTSLDAVLCVHGTGGNFYSSGLFDVVAARLLKQGIAVLRVNTRGHDAVSTASTRQGGKRQGAAFERFDDCRFDLAAWTDFLRNQGYSRIGWAGHSSGAVKCVYAASLAPELPPRILFAISPPRLSHSWFKSSSMGGIFMTAYQRADEAMREGRGESLMEIRFPLPMLISAAGYIDKYGPLEKYNFLTRIANLPCPAQFVFGSQEVANNVAFLELPEAVRDAAADRPIETTVVDGADHFYTGKETELAGALSARLNEDLLL